MSREFEYSRKIIHLSSLLIPFAALYSKVAVQAILAVFIVYYAYAEWCKLKGKPFSAKNPILGLQRPDEKIAFAPAPLYLALGCLGAITFFRFEASLVGIYQVGLCDSIAAFVGKRWGQYNLPFMKRKTYLGTAAFFMTALPVTMTFLPPSKAIAVSLVGAFLESLPIRALDNLTIPLIVGFLVEQYL